MKSTGLAISGVGLAALLVSVCAPVKAQTCNDAFDCTGGKVCSNGLCGGLYASCVANDGSSRGESAQCADGYYCLYNACYDVPPADRGESCTYQAQCPFGVSCGSGICGGEYSYCTPDGATPPRSDQCAPDYYCSNYVCTSQVPSQLGETCVSSYQCPTGVDCSYYDYTCGGLYAYCTPDDGSPRGPSSQCSDGNYCYRYRCYPGNTLPSVGDQCSDSIQCPDNVYCANGVCGGENAYCFDQNGCDSGLTCSKYQCTRNLGTVGDPCSSSNQCAGNVYCNGITCGGTGAYCLPPDGSSSSDADDSTEICDNGQSCLRNYCLPYEPRDLGETCQVQNQCPGYLSGCSYVDNLCGGEQAYCQSDDNCAPGYRCDTNACTAQADKAIGEDCTYNSECDTNVYCSSGICGGEYAYCGVYSERNSPRCDDSAPNCAGYFCSTMVVSALGEACTANTYCEISASGYYISCNGYPNGYCGGNGAYCIVPGEPDGTGNSDMCASGYCTNYACSDVPSPGRRKRDATQARYRGSMCPFGEVACPVKPKGFECIDPMKTLESCGGCTHGTIDAGIDCTILPNVENVECINGKCVVSACVDGYQDVFHNGTCVEV